MISLTVLNGNDKFVKLGNSAPLFFLSQEGMDGAQVAAVLSKSPYQRGKTRVGCDIAERLVSIKGCVVTDDLAAFEAQRHLLLQAFSPLHPLTMVIQGETYERQFSNVQVVDGPTFDDADYNSPDGIVFFNVSVVAPGHFMEEVNATTIALSEVVALFSFPLQFDGTLIFGLIDEGRTIIDNTGDVPAPLVVRIPGPVQTPAVFNDTTGEFIRINTPILAHETMVINTSFGNKSVDVYDDAGNRRNAFHYIDLKSTFFQLAIGENKLRFEAEAGNDKANVEIAFKRQYLGI